VNAELLSQPAIELLGLLMLGLEQRQCLQEGASRVASDVAITAYGGPLSLGAKGVAALASSPPDDRRDERFGPS
jgi:hypothetical protein